MCIRGKQNGLNLDFNVIKSFDWLKEMSMHDIVLTGGEPTLHPDFEQIVMFFCNCAKTVTVTSNGTTDYYLKSVFLRDNLYFQISLDGAKSVHDSIRGKGSFSKTLSTLRKLDKIGANYNVASVVSKKNIDMMLELEDTLQKLKNMKCWRLSYEMPFGSKNFNDMISASEWNKFVDYMIDNVQLKMKVQKIFPFDLYNRKKNELSEMVSKSGRCFNCGSGKDKIYIFPDYNVYSCTCLTDFCLGNLKQESLMDIFNGNKIKRFSQYKINPGVLCNSCEYKEFCNGGCIGMSYHYYGQLGMGDIRCPKLGIME
jgi:radical SAM protein with 4Fe4S-binding SPASM domain